MISTQVPWLGTRIYEIIYNLEIIRAYRPKLFLAKKKKNPMSLERDIKHFLVGPYHLKKDHESLMQRVVITWLLLGMENIIELSEESKATLPIQKLIYIPSLNHMVFLQY